MKLLINIDFISYIRLIKNIITEFIHLEKKLISFLYKSLKDSYDFIILFNTTWKKAQNWRREINRKITKSMTRKPYILRGVKRIKIMVKILI